MDKLKWNLALYEIKDNKFQNQPGPKKSGIYLCTCIRSAYDDKTYRYLSLMEYDAHKRYWHDPHRPHALSHIVLAWAETDMCKIDDSEFELYVDYPIKKESNMQ